ncbi:hypothetical protein XENTR_v10022285, partial [Xenopus tropicalis]
DMDRNIFFFPKKSVDDYVVLKPVVTGPLNNFTVCLRSYTEVGNSALFTLGTPKSQVRNMFVIYQSHIPYSLPFYYSIIYINNTQVYITGKANPLDWNHICVTWDSDTGVLQLWVNGKVSPLAVLQKGFSIDLQDGISLGQMQRYYRYHSMEWDREASFQGEITDVHMWNEVLPPETIWQVQRNSWYTSGNVISWRSLNYAINGDVIVQPKLY